jgi:UDP-N-acetylglucosamine transferase subunit ALG13
MRALMVATPGGHLRQLLEFAPRLEGVDTRVWLTAESPQLELIPHDDEVVLVPDVSERDLSGVLGSLAHARRLVRAERYDLAVSTGAALSIGYLVTAATRGIPVHYIESFTRVAGPSRTGRLLAYVPNVSLYTQHRHNVRGKWRFAGSVFDGFSAEPIPRPEPIRRAVVSLGTCHHDFRRLVERVLGLLGHEVETLWQTGLTDVDGLSIDARSFVAADELTRAMREADLVVSHAGTGSALVALSVGKLPVLVPREADAREVRDDHQLQLAGRLEELGLVIRRRVEELTAEDLALAARQRIVRARHVPPLRLPA